MMQTGDAEMERRWSNLAGVAKHVSGAGFGVNHLGECLEKNSMSRQREPTNSTGGAGGFSEKGKHVEDKTDHPTRNSEAVLNQVKTLPVPLELPRIGSPFRKRKRDWELLSLPEQIAQWSDKVRSNLEEFGCSTRRREATDENKTEGILFVNAFFNVTCWSYCDGLTLMDFYDLIDDVDNSFCCFTRPRDRMEMRNYLHTVLLCALRMPKNEVPFESDKVNKIIADEKLEDGIAPESRGKVEEYLKALKMLSPDSETCDKRGRLLDAWPEGKSVRWKNPLFDHKDGTERFGIRIYYQAIDDFLDGYYWTGITRLFPELAQ
ncbi:hypothetical protein BJ508DRAFT_308886 [Ascobolus immersus RN42]|uniref:Uncharacterized protein n=1 Tax=Ascobolus immersus RN42 TaxID=1160509 RepID=A0A3N4HY99_ASCIM|nr:hypothetical protein BJ508DRAFT_308886 [Ascobolus immersus RN42]